jgi:hypothetical protein
VTVLAVPLTWADIDATAAYAHGRHAARWLRARTGRGGLVVWADGSTTLAVDGPGPITAPAPRHGGRQCSTFGPSRQELAERPHGYRGHNLSPRGLGQSPAGLPPGPTRWWPTSDPRTTTAWSWGAGRPGRHQRILQRRALVEVSLGDIVAYQTAGMVVFAGAGQHPDA